MITTPTIENLTMVITQEIQIDASLETTFASLLAQLGRLNETPDGTPMPMTLEAWPGGRWFRELGGDNGHLWGFVQSIKRPALLEIYGPLFMSNATMSNVQYRLKESAGGTLMTFRHSAVGVIEEDHRGGLVAGWTPLHERIRREAEQQDRR